jgi:hypothetical protein
LKDNAGITIRKPHKPIITTARKRGRSGLILTFFTNEDIASVKNEKLVIMPNVIPKGFLFPPVDDEESTIGRSGQIQGASMVMNPETKANKSNIIVLYLSLL